MDITFPNASKAVPPHILENIFFYSNKHQDLRILRMVSKSWRNFISSEMLGRAKMVSKLDANQTAVRRRTERKALATNHGVTGIETTVSSNSKITLGINCIIIHCWRNSSLIFNFRGDYVDCIEFDIEQQPFNLSTLFDYSNGLIFGLFSPYRDFGYKFQAYKSVKTESPMERMEHGLNLNGIIVMGLKWVNVNELLLICLDSNSQSVIVINVVNGTETVIPGKFEGKTYNDCISVDNDGQFMATFWFSENNNNSLHLIDLVHGVEVWTKYYWGSSCHSLLQTSEYTCLVEKFLLGSYSMVHFFDNVTGLLGNSFSTSPKYTVDIKYLPGSKFFWVKSHLSVTNAFAICTYCPKEGKVKMMGQSENRLSVNLISDVIADRFILLHSKLKSTTISNLMALEVFDLVEDKSTVVDEGSQMYYEMHLTKNKVLCKTRTSKRGCLEVVKFNWPYCLNIRATDRQEALRETVVHGYV